MHCPIDLSKNKVNFIVDVNFVTYISNENQENHNFLHIVNDRVAFLLKRIM